MPRISCKHVEGEIDGSIGGIVRPLGAACTNQLDVDGLALGTRYLLRLLDRELPHLLRI